MSLDYYETLHRHRAEQFERHAAVQAATHRLRRARRLERTAHAFAAVAGWLDRLACRLDARAGLNRAHLL